MGRVKERYNINEVLENDELEEREQMAHSRKEKRKRKRKRIRQLFVLFLLLLGSAYLISDYSNIQVVEISGNQYYSKQQLMDKAKIALQQKSFLSPSFLIEKRLQDDALIEDVSVEKSWDGIIRIKVKESKLIGYYKEKDAYYLMIDDADDVKIKDVSKLANVPYLVDLDENQKKTYQKQMALVERENIALVSEVARYETSYDKSMVRLTMQDGHVVRTTIKDLKLLNSYTEILKGLKSDLRCIVFVGETNSMYTEKCE